MWFWDIREEVTLRRLALRSLKFITFSLSSLALRDSKQYTHSMIWENRQLVTNEPVEFEK